MDLPLVNGIFRASSNFTPKLSLGNKKCSTTKTTQNRKKTKLFLCDDTLEEVLKWIPRINLPNVDEANYRFWRFSVPLLNGFWPHFIGRLRITGKHDGVNVDKFIANQMEIVHGKDRKLVPVAVTEPPKSILGIKVVTIRDFVSNDVIRFFRSVRGMLRDSVLTLRDLDNFLTHDELFVNEFLALFKRCYKIELVKASILADKKFFARPEIFKCRRLFIWDPQQDFELSSTLDWLHAARDGDQRWMLLDARFSPIEMVIEFLEKIKQMFDEDEGRSNFVVQIYPPDRLPIFLIERLKTEEVLILYRVPNKLSYRLKRCLRKDTPDDVIEFVQDAAPQIPYFPFFLKAVADRNRSQVYVGPLQGFQPIEKLKQNE